MNARRFAAWVSSMTALAFVLGAPAIAGAQLFGPNASTVQLPTFQQFTIDTSVMVPAGGGVMAGGVSGSGASSRVFGPNVLYPQSATGGGVNAGGVSVHATIHDIAAMDVAVLSQALDVQPPKRASQAIGSPTGPPRISVAEIRRAQEAEACAVQDEALKYLALARQAEASGHAGAARVYYAMVVRRAAEPLRSEAAEKLRSLSSSPLVSGAASAAARTAGGSSAPR